MGIRHRAVCAIGTLAFAVGCGGGGGGGSSAVLPAAPSGTVVSIQVTSSGPAVFLGTPETFSAIATYSSGGTQTIVGGVWSTDNGTIAIVDATGKFIPEGNGEVTVFIDFQGVRGSKKIRVLPNYAGLWIGSYTVTSCTQTDGFADGNLCSNFVGQAPQFFFQFTQATDTLSGYTGLGRLPIGSTIFTATIDLDGSVAFTTQFFIGTTEIDVAWSLTCAVAGVINGTVSQTWQDSTVTGQMVVAGDIHNPAKQAVARVQNLGGLRPTLSLAEAIAAAVRP
jgi:hypothetical protein